MKARKLFRIVVLLALTAMLAVPAASAQSSKGRLFLETISVNYSTGDSIKPDIGSATVAIDWSYSTGDTGFELQAESAPQTTLEFTKNACDNPNIIITGSTVYPIEPTKRSSAGGSSEPGVDDGTATFQAVATQDAPGETQVPCEWKAKAGALGTQVEESSETSIRTNLVVDFLGLLSVNVPSTIKEAGPQKEIRFEMEISNLGNSRSNIRFDMLGESSSKWNPVVPTEIVLESSSQGGTATTKNVNFVVSTPFKNGWNNDDTTFQLRVTPVSTKDTDKEGTPTTVNVLARVRGVYVPSLEPLVMLGAVLGTGLLVRRLGEE